MTTSTSRGEKIVRAAKMPPGTSVVYEGATPFGPRLVVDAFRLHNGLRILCCEDHSAPVVAYHTWFRVGSRHERKGKTGIAHLFEHLMFNETEKLPAGEFDRRLEAAGAESNASTWMDWTHYNVAVPRDQIGLVIDLESERMAHLVLRDPQVSSEKEVVANERRYRVDDDVEGALNELLWKTAFSEHAYGWPTIGWMEDIEGFSTDDCLEFYRTYYSPNNATIVVAGDFAPRSILEKIGKAYGGMPPATLPIENPRPEPPHTTERRVEVTKPTATDKIALGYPCPALGDYDHPAASILLEILTGGRASRLQQRLVRRLEIATDVRGGTSPLRDPGLIEISVSAREGKRAEEALDVIDEELRRVRDEPVSAEELERARARLELGLLAGLETVDGKASTMGFDDTVVGRPAASFERLDAARRVTAGDILRVARRFLAPESRSIVIARPNGGAAS